MMVKKGETVRTIRKDLTVGALIDAEHYKQIKTYLLGVLDTQDPIPANELIELAHHEFCPVFKAKTGWYLYNVKADLEVKGLITHLHAVRRRGRAMVTKGNVRLDGINSSKVSPTDFYSNRIHIDVRSRFIDFFNKEPLMVYAPGSINLAGEYTEDHEGLVLTVPVNHGIHLALGSSKIRTQIHALNSGESLTINLDDPSKGRSAWQNCVAGILFRLKTGGYPVRPFSCVFNDDSLLGSEIGALAALESALLAGLSSLFNLKISEIERIRIAQWSERYFANVRFKLADKFTSTLGKDSSLISLDCQSSKFNYVPIELKGYSLLLLDSKVKDKDRIRRLKIRSQECAAGVDIIRSTFPQVTSLRDVTPEMLTRCAAAMPIPVLNRCLYVIQENNRVIKSAEDVRKGDWISFGQTMYESHKGLSELYDVSCAEVDFLVGFAKGYDGVAGSRMTDKGSGRCTITLIDNRIINTFLSEVMIAFKKEFKRPLRYRVFEAGQGVRIAPVSYSV